MEIPLRGSEILMPREFLNRSRWCAPHREVQTERYLRSAASQFWTTVIEPVPLRSGKSERKRCSSGIIVMKMMSDGSDAIRRGGLTTIVSPGVSVTCQRLLPALV